MSVSSTGGVGASLSGGAGLDAAAPKISLGADAEPNVVLPSGGVDVDASLPSGGIQVGGGGSADDPVAVEEEIQAVGAKQVESGFGFSMPGLSVSFYFVSVFALADK